MLSRIASMRAITQTFFLFKSQQQNGEHNTGRVTLLPHTLRARATALRVLSVTSLQSHLRVRCRCPGGHDIFLLLCRDLHSTLIVRVTSDAWLFSLCFFNTPKEHEYQSVVDAALQKSPSEHQGLAVGSESRKAFVFSWLGRFVHLRAIVFAFLRALTDRKLMMPLLRNTCFDNDHAR